MSFRSMVGILRKRWYAALAVLAVVAGLSWPVYHPKPEYQATAVLLLVPPKLPTAPNALAATSPSIAATGLAVDDLMESAAQVRALAGAGVTDSFTVAPRNSGTEETPAYTIPSEELTVTGPDPDRAVTEVTELISAFENDLTTIQANVGVVARNQISAGSLAQPSVGELHGAKSRGLLGMALLGMGGAVALPLWLDRRLPLRKRGRKADVSTGMPSFS